MEVFLELDWVLEPGDMLYLPSGTGLPIRVHGAFVSDDEVHRVVEYLKTQGEPNYIEGILEGGTLSEEQMGVINKLINATKTNVPLFCKMYGVDRVEEIPVLQYGPAKTFLEIKQERQNQ